MITPFLTTRLKDGCREESIVLLIKFSFLLSGLSKGVQKFWGRFGKCHFLSGVK
jgi:hypothetical protein